VVNIINTRRNTRRSTAAAIRQVVAAAVAAQAQVGLETRQRRLGRGNRRNTRNPGK